LKLDIIPPLQSILRHPLVFFAISPHLQILMATSRRHCTY